MEYTIIGGGLSGLFAAVTLAKQGRKVRLYEKRQETGGRAISTVEKGVTLNLGPHALYRNGKAMRTLASWGIAPRGGVPDLRGYAQVQRDGRLFKLPLHLMSLLRSPLFTIPEKLECARAFSRITSRAAKENFTAAQWLDEFAPRPRVRQYFECLFRLLSFCAQMDDLSMSALARQAKIGEGGVLYLDGGWQTLVDSLEKLAKELGVEMRTGESGGSIERNTILAVPPEEAERLTGVALPPRIPLRMACLDIALERVPSAAPRFVLGLDRPLYFSMHSQWARLAPAGTQLAHVGYYLRPGEEVTRPVLEEFCDGVMPGWRERAIHVRYLPHLLVTHAAPAPAPRAEIDSLDKESVLLAGDWVGSDGMLADAAAASALAAAGRLSGMTHG